MAYTLDFALNLGSSKTGLTLVAQIVDSDGADVGTEVTTGFTEVGTGCYIWTGSIPDAHQGAVKFYESGVPATILAIASINPAYLETVPEAYHAKGDTPTLGQLLWLTYAGVLLKDLDGTSLRIRNDAGTIVATYTITLNSQGYPVVSERLS
jgi:hypothetical protein